MIDTYTLAQPLERRGQRPRKVSVPPEIAARATRCGDIDRPPEPWHRLVDLHDRDDNRIINIGLAGRVFAPCELSGNVT
jgi:hypothetical protein